MRSKHLLHFHNHISELNTHYSHLLFISQEFLTQNGEKISRYSESETIEVFSENIYARQFNVKLKDFPKEYENTKQFLIRSLFLLSYFQLEIYLKDIYFFLNGFIHILPDLTPKISALTQLTKHGVLNSVDKETLNTIEYLKLRRNTIVHRDESHIAQGTISDFIKKNGKSLNKYWQSAEKDQEKNKSKPKVPKIKSLDFSFSKADSLYRFTNDEVIDILNLLRYFSELVDNCILKTVGNDKLTEHITIEFDQIYENDSRVQASDNETREKKFNHYLMMFYGTTQKELEN
ncbi:MAG: hypothetical protein HGB36_13835 [Chlorobiaceae bacterium]|nr:hypothetical protein [Chlorobiaceae bacterium]